MEFSPGRPPDRRRGRPLDPSLHGTIQAAVLEVLSEAGYRGLTMDEVAMVAGVSKATIYRRWHSKVDLLVSVIEAASEQTLIEVDHGNLRDDLVAALRALVEILAGWGGGASRALLGALEDEPALAEAYRRGPLARWRDAFTAAFERAAARGEVHPGAEASLAAEAGSGILLQRWLVSGRQVDEQVASAVVDEVMMPLLRRG